MTENKENVILKNWLKTVKRLGDTSVQEDVIVILVQDLLARREKSMVGSDKDVDLKPEIPFTGKDSYVHIEHPYQGSKPKQKKALFNNAVLDEAYELYKERTTVTPHSIEDFIAFLKTI